ncbi:MULTISPECIES: flagellar assembly peptidoglycan hydrolase FlgJ [Vibrio]|uniref:Peptidoglycan hydrolase FlgJ n=2 Tax=Vibrio TaxID=662 RepID=A0A1E5DBN5_9VIBR|nr:flagellar assembly peptidoglycan hydrolase FlgJ [Vibrio genomosp. F6]OEE81189.1 flagellar rod assembly protein/muramidase FlgJ [Vibrio genomosp. F6 str. FF-238]TKF22671.1 flagellar assembly peptidoglycan hydrolase FlgJ [Vibrio genomosp. F6]
MIKNPTDVGFVHDISSLDRLRQQAVNGEEGDEKAALTAAAKQFESIFTSMLFKSMRDANSSFKSDMMNSQNEDFYRQMLDDQMSTELSSSGSLGLADMIVAQLSQGQSSEVDKTEVRMRNEAFDTSLRLPVNEEKARLIADRVLKKQQTSPAEPTSFESPQSFVQSMRPYAEKAAKTLGVEPSLLLAQAALETGWGQKVVQNSVDNSNNLFNIKADRSWKGDKIATQTLEFHDNTPVKESASFRSYSSYQESFNDYVRFLNDNPRYKTALQVGNGDELSSLNGQGENGDNSEVFIRGIHQAGYATDPQYADKVLRVKAKIDQMN